MRKSKGKEGLSRLLAILLFSSTLFGLTACGHNSGASEPGGTQEISSSQQSSIQQSSSTKTPEPVASSEEPVIGADVEVPQESTPKTAGSKPEPKEATASEDEWKALYKEVLLNKGTYSNISENGQVYLIDVDGNGIPELYVADTPPANEMYLVGVYDASTGKLEQKTFETNEVYFGSLLVADKVTGDRGLRGWYGGTMVLTEFILKPDLTNMTFEELDIKTNYREWNEDEQQNTVANTEEHNKDTYESLPSSEQPGEPLRVVNGSVPSEDAVNTFLGIEAPKPTVTDTPKSDDWSALYKDYLNNQMDWEGISFVTLTETDDIYGVPVLHAGYHAMEYCYITVTCYIKDGKIVVEHPEPPVEFANEGNWPMLQGYMDKPTEQEIENFIAERT